MYLTQVIIELGKICGTKQIGNTSNEHIQISSSGLRYLTEDRYIGIPRTLSKIGSVANGITLDTSGNATFNGSITINVMICHQTASGSAN